MNQYTVGISRDRDVANVHVGKRGLLTTIMHLDGWESDEERIRAVEDLVHAANASASMEKAAREGEKAQTTLLIHGFTNDNGIWRAPPLRQLGNTKAYASAHALPNDTSLLEHSLRPVEVMAQGEILRLGRLVGALTARLADFEDQARAKT